MTLHVLCRNRVVANRVVDQGVLGSCRSVCIIVSRLQSTCMGFTASSIIWAVDRTGTGGLTNDLNLATEGIIIIAVHSTSDAESLSRDAAEVCLHVAQDVNVIVASQWGRIGLGVGMDGEEDSLRSAETDPGSLVEVVYIWLVLSHPVSLIRSQMFVSSST